MHRIAQNSIHTHTHTHTHLSICEQEDCVLPLNSSHGVELLQVFSKGLVVVASSQLNLEAVVSVDVSCQPIVQEGHTFEVQGKFSPRNGVKDNFFPNHPLIVCSIVYLGSAEIVTRLWVLNYTHTSTPVMLVCGLARNFHQVQ